MTEFQFKILSFSISFRHILSEIKIIPLIRNRTKEGIIGRRWIYYESVKTRISVFAHGHITCIAKIET